MVDNHLYHRNHFSPSKLCVFPTLVTLILHKTASVTSFVTTVGQTNFRHLPVTYRFIPCRRYFRVLNKSGVLPFHDVKLKSQDRHTSLTAQKGADQNTLKPGVVSSPTTNTITKTVVLDESVDEVYASDFFLLSRAAIVGILTGMGVSGFKISIDTIRQVTYGTISSVESIDNLSESFFMLIIPALGGVMVSLLLFLFGEFSPGLRGTVAEVDASAQTFTNKFRNTPSDNRVFFLKANVFAKFVQKLGAATFTLGTGNSLGPEGTSVEIGMASSRILMRYDEVRNVNDNKLPLSQENTTGVPANSKKSEFDTLPSNFTPPRIQEQRLLLSCGAAAGVSAGFNAPISGVFFALEIVQAALSPVSTTTTSSVRVAKDGASTEDDYTTQPAQQQLLLFQSLASRYSITCILLSSVVSSLVSQILLGKELALRVPEYEIGSYVVVELPLFLVLGGISGLVAFAFSQCAKFFKDSFDGVLLPSSLSTEQPTPNTSKSLSNYLLLPFHSLGSLPTYAKPAVGGLTCGLAGIFYPQILFFGYETLNGLLNESNLPLQYLLALLVAKTLTTAVSVGSGLIGGTFAPSLFLGALAGSSFHRVVLDILNDSGLVVGDANLVGDVPAYALVGAASTLAALYRAPLTASLLVFELTRDYEVILPLLASAGIASLLGDVVDDAFEKEQRRRRDEDNVSWGDLSDEMTTIASLLGDVVEKGVAKTTGGGRPILEGSDRRDDDDDGERV